MECKDYLCRVKLQYAGLPFRAVMMEKRIYDIDTIPLCNNFFAGKTGHPLVSVISPGDKPHEGLFRFGFYAVLLNEKGGYRCSGWKECDFSAGIMTFMTPGSPFCMETWSGGSCTMLLFHPDIMRGAAKSLHRHTFFRYRKDEALHLSARETAVMKECLENIRQDIVWSVDEFSQTIIAERIGLLLDYGDRFYKRQFITRHERNAEALESLQNFLDKYFLSGQAVGKGLPDPAGTARIMGMSAAYLSDMLEEETGKDIKEFIRYRQFSAACNQLERTDKSIEEISRETGYRSAECFCDIFVKVTGKAPRESGRK